MTVVAIGHGPPGTFNLLLADTTVMTGDGICEKQKVASCGGETFCTVVGDELVRDATAYLAYWHEPRELDLLDANTALACFEGASRLRTVHAALGHQPPAASGATLFVVSRNEAFCWEASLGPDGTYTPPVGPAHVSEGELWVFYGGTAPQKFRMTPDAADPFAEAARYIGSVHKEATRKITLARFRFGGVTAPHDPKTPYRWERPFRDLQDLWAREHPSLHGQRDRGLMGNAAYVTKIPVPKLKP